MFVSRKTLFLAVVLFAAGTCAGMAKLPPLIPFHADGKWGYSDSTGTLVVQARYDTTMILKNGIGITGIKLDSCPGISYKRPCTLLGAVDSTGREILPPVFIDVLSLEQECNIARKFDADTNMAFGVLDSRGEMLTPFKYRNIEQITDHLMLLRPFGDEPPQIFDMAENQVRAGNPVFNNFYERRGPYAMIRSKSGLGIIDSEGRMIVDSIYREIAEAEHDLFVVGHFRNHFVYSGCVNTDGSLVVPTEYDEITMLTRDLILATDDLGQEEFHYWLYHRDGRRLNTTPFYEVDTMGHNRFLATRRRGIHNIDASGNIHRLTRWEDSDWRGFAGNYRTKPIYVNGVAAYEHLNGIGYMNMRGEDLKTPKIEGGFLDHVFEKMFPSLEYMGWPSPEVEHKLSRQVDEIVGFSEGWAVFRRNDKCGLINAEGRELFYGRYDELTSVRNGCAIATDHNYYPERFVYVDTSGKVLTDPEKTDYNMCYPFVDDRALVREQRMYGFLGRDGNEVIAPEFTSALQFSNGLARVKSSNWGAIDKNGKVVIPMDYEQLDSIADGIASAKRNGKWTYVQPHKGELFAPRYERAHMMQHGLGIVEIGQDSIGCVNMQGKLLLALAAENGRIAGPGIVNIDDRRVFNAEGREILPGRFEALRWVSEDLFAARDKGVWKFVDGQGNEQAAGSYDDIKPLNGTTDKSELVAAVRRGAWTFVKRDLREIVKPMYRSFERLDSGYIAAYLADEQLMYGGDGQLVHAFYDSTINRFVNPGGLWKVSCGNNVGFVDTSGSLVIPIVYDANTKNMPRFGSQNTNRFYRNGLAMVSLDGSARVIDIKGNTILQDNKERIIQLSNDGTVHFNIKDGDGYLNGRPIYNPFSGSTSEARFLYTASFHGNAFVKANDTRDRNTYGIIDTNGRYVVPPLYSQVGDFEDGYFPLRDSSGKWGVIDSTGRIVLEFKYDNLSKQFDVYGPCFRGEADGKTFLLSVTRPPLDISAYRETFRMEEGFIFVKSDEGCGVIDSFGNIVVPLRWDNLTGISAELFYVRTADGLMVPHDIYGRVYKKE